MWIVELNVAGHRFTREVHGHPRTVFDRKPRVMAWLPSLLRHPGAA